MLKLICVSIVLALGTLPSFSETGATCGGIAGTQCSEKEWCSYPEGSACGKSDATGTCEARPEFCTMDYKPVCGCDGVTYSNACGAQTAGTDVAQDGECTGG